MYLSIYEYVHPLYAHVYAYAWAVCFIVFRLQNWITYIAPASAKFFPIVLALYACLKLLHTYYAKNYSGVLNLDH